ncbi:hypothetical protein DXG01_005601 [Tephrocybe rancida]|nr:hypothetical protein DXG01_005601 [Tephrocybe rancida]
MHTKSITLALLALIAASSAAPLADRLSWSSAQRQGLSAQADADCNDEAATYGLASGKTEADCANTEGATGFRVGSATSACSFPTKGSGKKGICYLGDAAAQRQVTEEEPSEPPTVGETPDDEKGESADDKKGEGADDKKDEGADDKKADDKESPASGKAKSTPCPDQSSPSEEAPPGGGETTLEQKPTSPPATSPQSPVQIPKPAPVQTSSSAVSTPSDKPGPPNAQVPHHPPPPPSANATANAQDNSLKWFGTSIFKILGGLF